VTGNLRGRTATVKSGFSVSWDGDELLSLAVPKTGSTFSQFSYQVRGTGSDTLEFRFRDKDGHLAMDDVSVSPKEIRPLAPPQRQVRLPNRG
jgi:hypothetical protein